MLNKKIVVILLLILISGILMGCENKTENSSIGYIQEDINTALPAELIGTWTVSEGLPDGLVDYELTFNENGEVTQTTQIDNGEPTTDTATASIKGDEITILDPNDTVLMTLNSSDGQLTTQDLGESNTVFTKTN